MVDKMLEKLCQLDILLCAHQRDFTGEGSQDDETPKGGNLRGAHRRNVPQDPENTVI